MKKLLIPALALLFFASCSKSSTTNNPPGTANTITETDETPTTTVHHNAIASNGYSSFSGNYVMNITSLEGPNTIELVISDTEPIAVKTYTNITGRIPVNILYGEYVTRNAANNCTVTITSLTATNVKGTFSGPVYNYGNSQTKTLSNGSFDVDIEP